MVRAVPCKIIVYNLIYVCIIIYDLPLAPSVGTPSTTVTLFPWFMWREVSTACVLFFVQTYSGDTTSYEEWHTEKSKATEYELRWSSFRWFSLVNVGSGFHCLRSFLILLSWSALTNDGEMLKLDWLLLRIKIACKTAEFSVKHMNSSSCSAAKVICHLITLALYLCSLLFLHLFISFVIPVYCISWCKQRTSFPGTFEDGAEDTCKVQLITEAAFLFKCTTIDLLSPALSDDHALFARIVDLRRSLEMHR